MKDDLDRHIPGEAIVLAARIKQALSGVDIQEEPDYGGVFYVRRVEIAYGHGDAVDTCLCLVPDEAEGKTLDAYTVSPAAPLDRVIDVVFDGPPSHQSGRFVEVEDEHGASVNVGEWVDRGNGFWALRIRVAGERA